MALASKYTANERLVRKRLAARLRQRRCRERKRELMLQKNYPTQPGTKSVPTSEDNASHRRSASPSGGTTTTLLQQPRKDALVSNESTARRYTMGISNYPTMNGYACTSPPVAMSKPRPDVTYEHARAPPPRPSTSYQTSTSPTVLANPATPVLTKSSVECEPAPISPGSSKAAAPSPVAVPLPPPPPPVAVAVVDPKAAGLASQEMAAIDAMLALRCKASHDPDGEEQETASTSSLSTKESSSGQQHPTTIPKSVVVAAASDARVEDCLTIPETVVYRPKYAIPSRLPPPPPLPSYRYPAAHSQHHHHHRPLPPPPPQPWGYHHLHYPPYPYHHHAHHPLPPPVPYWKAGPPPASAATPRGVVRP